MYVGRDFQPIEPGETDTFSLELTADFLPGQQAAGSSWTCTVVKTDPDATADTDPQARLIGEAQLSIACNRIYTAQRIGGMLAGNYYRLEATVTRSDGTVIQRYSHVYCQTPC